MRLTLVPAVAATAAAFLPTTIAWGAAGHEIVATIAQIHLHPAVRERLCSILPPTAHCHLAPVAAWADLVRRYYPETGPMHYVNPKEDYPAERCTFGEYGWINEDVNVLTGIMNKTQAVADGEGDIPLRFLIHFLGDLHQPLHLTGRDKGGNGAQFLWEGRRRSLHSVWDSGILTKKLRELGNYTSPLPNKEVEGALPGAIFDPYVRWIVWEGIREWWRADVDSWIACPLKGDPYPHSQLGSYPEPRKPSRGALAENALHIASGAAEAYLPDAVWTLLRPLIPASIEATHGFEKRLLDNTPSRLQGNETNFPACPYTWSRETHQVNCDIAWPREYHEGGPLMELDTPEYMGKITDLKILERLLAQGGLRLAKILNMVVGEGKFSPLYFAYE